MLLVLSDLLCVAWVSATPPPPNFLEASHHSELMHLGPLDLLSDLGHLLIFYGLHNQAPSLWSFTASGRCTITMKPEGGNSKCEELGTHV